MKRDIAVCIILSIVTCGIYWLYWECKLNREVSAMNGKNPEVDGAVFVLLCIVTCSIYHIYWNYKMGTLIDESRAARGYSNNNFGILFLVLALFQISGIVTCALMQNEINNTAIV